MENIIENPLKPSKFLNPALDFFETGAIVGFRAEVGHEGRACSLRLTIVSNGEIRLLRDAEAVMSGEESLFVRNGKGLPDIEEKWSLEQVQALIANPQDEVDLLGLITGGLTQYLDLPDDQTAKLLATFIITTYFTPLFRATPFLHILGPKESGKSTLLEVLELTCFNAFKLNKATLASLGDAAESLRGAILWDQAERIPRELVGVLADSYKRNGGKRQIVRTVKGEREVKVFSLYGPKVFASIRDLDRDLADRCIQIGMQRTRQRLTDLIGDEAVWRQIRDALYRFLLLRWQEVSQAYLEIPSGTSRRGELWRPLGAVLKVLDVPDEEQRAIKAVFENAMSKTRHQLEMPEEALFQVLLDKAAGEAEFAFTAVDIQKRMEPLLEKSDRPTVQWIGLKLSEFNLALGKKKRGRRKIVQYKFAPRQVVDIANRYLDGDSE